MRVTNFTQFCLVCLVTFISIGFPIEPEIHSVISRKTVFGNRIDAIFFPTAQATQGVDVFHSELPNVRDLIWATLVRQNPRGPLGLAQSLTGLVTMV